jgi:hypothetical protein
VGQSTGNKNVLCDQISELGHQNDENAKGLGLSHGKAGELGQKFTHLPDKFVPVQHPVL